jgi:hypothetical protein
MTLEQVGALCFGLVVGWICYRTLRRSQDKAALSDLATVVGVVGGGVVTALFKQADVFAVYSIGLAAGFFTYLIVSGFMDPKGLGGWMKGKDGSI